MKAFKEAMVARNNGGLQELVHVPHHHGQKVKVSLSTLAAGRTSMMGIGLRRWNGAEAAKMNRRMH